MSVSVLGDGCPACNPAKAYEYAVQTIEDQKETIRKLDTLIKKMQADATMYLIPDNECGAEWFISRTLWHLDGPEQREAQDF